MKEINLENPEWIMDGLAFYSPGYFETIGQIRDEDTRNLQSLGQARSKFPEKNVYDIKPYSKEDASVPNILVSVSSFGDASVELLDLDTIVKMSDCDIFTFSGDISHKINGDCYVSIVECSDTKRIIGSGSKTFEVIATIRDEYRLEVQADDEDQAIFFANGVDISQWKHPDIEPELSERRLIRHARWGNLRATEIS